MRVDDYCESFIRESQSGELTCIQRRAIEQLAVEEMRRHVREHLGDNPSGGDSNVNVVYLSMLGSIVNNMRNP